MQQSSAPSVSSSDSFPASAQFELRYDDLTQHGHIKLSSLQLVLGRVCFEKVWRRHPLFETHKQLIAPILSRLVLEADADPISLTALAEGRGRIELAHARDADGAVKALFLNTYGEIWGARSRRAGPGQARPSVRIGRAFGEHVFTKPFGDPAERKVLAFAVPGQPALPSATHARVDHAGTTRLPTGAQALDANFAPDTSPWVFGLTHTDLNQHVNSLVYARFFEEAALRRLAKFGNTAELLGQRIELNYRKPCFAGQPMVCMLRAFQHDEVLGAVGYLVPEGGSLERAHCSFQLQFRRIALHPAHG